MLLGLVRKSIPRLQNILRAAAVCVTLSPVAAYGQLEVTITVDANAGRHLISPLIYGVNLASRDQLSQLNSPANRLGGNNMTRYNWSNNTCSQDNDYYFESPPGRFWPLLGNSVKPSQHVDDAISYGKSAGATTLVTVPTMGWVAKVNDPSITLSSFSVKKYGPQQATAPEQPDAGNGIKPDGTKITDNDPNDASVPITPSFERPWIQHLVKTFGDAIHGGITYFLMDNEPALWQETHRDVHPLPETSKEDLDDIINYGSMVKSIDPNAQICAPDEWGWSALSKSGADNVYSGQHNYTNDTPDRASRGGMDNLPWILQQIAEHDKQTGKRLLDVLDMHIYPQGGDGNDDVSEKTELLRNRDTRQLWDPNYVDESWIKQSVALIPTLKEMIAAYYPGTKIGITEYNWGAEKYISGALAQADILGIFGREGVYLATRWIAPDITSVTFKAMQMYRNYDGKDGSFGSMGVADTPSSNPDDLSSFAAIRQSDGALTVMVINKQLSEPAQISIKLQNIKASTKPVEIYQLTATNTITRLDDSSVTDATVTASVPQQSITLFVIPNAK